MAIPGFEVPLHRSLTEPILLAGAPRAVAIVNGTIAAALGLGLRLWIAGIAFGLIGHAVAVFAAGAAVASNGLPDSSNSDDSAASSTADSDAGTGAGGDAAGGKAETTPEAATDGALRAAKPSLNADNVDAYARDLAEGKRKATAPRAAMGQTASTRLPRTQTYQS